MRRLEFNFLLALCFVAAAATLLAQRPETQGSVSGSWIERIPYDPPNSSQNKWEISGSEANTIPDSGGKILLKGVRIKQFPPKGGDAQMLAEAPQCITDRSLDAVSSTGPLQVHAQGDKFFVQGTGFLLRQAESMLWISNDVHSLIQTQNATNAPVGPATEIFSRRARFEMKPEAENGLALYEGDVRVNDPKFKLTCELLTAELPRPQEGQTNRVNRIIAETNVMIDFVNTNGEHTLVSAQKAVYDRTNNNGVDAALLNLTGNPRVDLTNGWMTADAFAMDRATGKLRGYGNFHFHYLGTNQPANAAPDPNALTAPLDTDIFSDEFELDTDTRLATFWGHVDVTNAQMKLVCETLTANLPKGDSGGTNRIDHIIADRNVKIDFVDLKSGATNHASGQKAVYDYKVANGVTNAIMELTGNPSVETGGKNPGWMTADVIKMDRAQGRIWGTGNHHSVIKKDAAEPVTMDTEIYSDDFEFANDTGLAVYRGNVHAYDPELNETSGVLTIKRAKEEPGQTNQTAPRLESIHAENDVSLYFLEKAFAAADITNLAAFATRMKQPADPVAQFVTSQLTEPTRELLSAYEDGTNAPLRQAFATDLNSLVLRGPVYDAQRFSGVGLSPDAQKLMDSHPLGVDLIELNRLVLLDAFRGQIKRTVSGEITHATGDTATYTFAKASKNTGGVLHLDGNPKLVQPDWTTTAEKSIVYDRTTGRSYTVGRSHIIANVRAFTNAKLPGDSKKTKDAKPKDAKKSP